MTVATRICPWSHRSRNRSPADLMFDYDSIVSAIRVVPANRLGAKAWVVGISPEERRQGSYREAFPTGTVYTIEFEDGESVNVHESDLVSWGES